MKMINLAIYRKILKSLIDEELNFVSQGIDGTYVRAGVGNQFVIKKEDEKFYICTLEAIE